MQDDRPTPIAEPLARLLRRIDPHQQMRVYRVWHFWAQEAGEVIAAQAQPAGFHAGILSVRVRSHAWMQELQFLKERLRERLNKRLGEDLIRDIYFVCGVTNVSQGAEARAEPADPEPALEPPALPPLRDPRLAAIFADLSRAHARRRRDH